MAAKPKKLPRTTDPKVSFLTSEVNYQSFQLWAAHTYPGLAVGQAAKAVFEECALKGVELKKKLKSA